MRYVIKEQFWSWGDDFHIFNENREPVFLVDGQAFSWGDKLSFQSMDGCELAYISQKMFSFKPKYEIYRSGRLVAQVSKALWSWTDSYGIEVAGGEDDGSILCAAIVIDQVLHDEKS